MADPPRRAATRPPPIPVARNPVAPAGAKTDVLRAPEADDTNTMHVADPAKLVERVLELVASEAEALLLANDDTRLADLNVRTALASWDALHQPDEAMRLLELADGHPLVARLRFAAAIASAELATLLAVEPLAASSPALLLELAEALLWRHGHLDKVTELVDRLLAGSLPDAWRAHAIELATLAHTAKGHWSRVIELRLAALGAVRGASLGPVPGAAPGGKAWGAAVDVAIGAAIGAAIKDLSDDTIEPETDVSKADPEEVAAVAAAMLDRESDAAGALALCWSKLEHFPGLDGTFGLANLPNTKLGWLRTFDVAIDAATVLDDERRFELLDKRADLVGALQGGAIEAIATRHAVASELERDGQLAEATTLWTRLADDPASQMPGVARRVALVRATWAAIGSKNPADRKAALAAHRRLADSECTEVAATHAWRALEL
ncbi:MAG: hypothetical protein H0V17_10900, partial [Deltaproteobacteria bacterium]|nr:hypothetical protein [Deltaproteobacteria bacterium]